MSTMTVTLFFSDRPVRTIHGVVQFTRCSNGTLVLTHDNKTVTEADPEEYDFFGVGLVQEAA